MSSDRIRDRQGACRIIDGAPCPDPSTTASLLPGVVVGEYLRRQRDVVRGRLLDLGAGNQPYADWYLGLCDEAVSTDIAPHAGLSVLCAAEGLPFANGSFDTVLATEVLEHVTDLEHTVDEICRVLAPGGAVIVTVPYFYPTHEPPHDHRRLTHHGLRGAFERRGLELQDLTAKGGLLTLGATVVTTAACTALRMAMLRSSGGISSLLARTLAVAERAMLALRARANRFPATAQRVSLGYMTVARKPAAEPGNDPRSASSTSSPSTSSQST